MRQKKLFFTLISSALVMLIVGFGVNAEAEQTDSDKIVEYESFEDILEEIETEAGDIRYLSSCERVDGGYQALYMDAETLQETIEANGSAASPLMFITVTREFTKTYTSYDAIPESFYYEGYDSELNTWVWGTVYLQSTERIDYGWKAVYKGTLQGQI